MVKAGERRCRGESGAEAVEFAIVVPVLLLIVIGIFQFGRAYDIKLNLTSAAREGARYLALNASDPNAVAHAETTAEAAAPGLDSASMSFVTVTPCRANPTNPPSAAQMIITYPWSWIGALLPPSTITAGGVMQCGG